MKVDCSEVESFGKGISCASRFRIVQVLFKGPKTVSELVSELNMAQPAVSQHLKILKGARIVASVRRGKEISYAVNSEYVLNLLSYLTQSVNTKVKTRTT